MAWSISTNDLARIGSFEAAEKHWNESVAWRNEHTSYRPLAGRHKTHMLMIKLSGGGYECVLYRTPIVTYYPDGSVKLATYSSQSTQLFAWNMRPENCRPVSHHGKMFWKVETVHGPHYQQDTMTLVPSDEDCMCWTVTNPGEMQKEWVLDRKKAAEVRKLIKPYGEWYEMTSRLMGNNLRTATSNYGYQRTVEQLLTEPTNFEAYPEMMRYLGHPKFFRQAAYEQYGARTKQPVPYDRLPKERS